MKLFYFTLLSCFSFVFTLETKAQSCSLDSSNLAPGIYPDTLPTGYVGQFYSEDINFVLPTDTLGYTFLNFHILSISLPVGLNWQCNNFSNGCNYDPAVNVYGCVNVFGTPLLPGQYPVNVTVIADLNVVSGYPVTFQSYIEILPSQTSTNNSGFSMIGAAGCLPITVHFTNNNPGLLAYAWNFGNGNTSTVENPAPQVYTNAGNFVVTYSAWSNLDTTHVYTLTNVTINTIQSTFAWGFPTELNPDPYFKIKENGAVIYQSTYFADQFPPVSWPVSILLDPTKTYEMEVWDEDDYEIFYGGDDLIGTHTMSLNGCAGCAAGTDAIVSYAINHVVIPPLPFITSVDTVRVYGYPGIPNVVYDSLNHTLSTDSTQYALQWFFNGSPIQGANAATHLVLVSGEYSVAAINIHGCPTFSNDITAAYCGNGFVPTILQNGPTLYTNDTLSSTFQWYESGNLISGATGSSFVPMTAGNFTIEVTDAFGCSYMSANFNLPLTVLENRFLNSLQIFPNPTNDILNLIWQNSEEVNEILISDLSGKIIRDIQISYSQKNISFSIEELASGTYLLILNGNNERAIRKITKY